MGLGATVISSISIAAVLHMQPNATTAPATPDNAKPPHLVMMVIDDLGWTDVGYHGSNFKTPNFDALAAEGVKLDNYYVQQVCSPTRSALMTARYPFRTGLQHTTTLAMGSTAAIPKDTATIAEVLKEANYSTHAIGKWHIGMSSWEDTPLGRGFNSFAGYLNGAEDYYTHSLSFTGLLFPNVSTKGGYDLWRNKTVAWDYMGTHSTSFYMDEAKRILDSHDPSTPLFLYFAHQEVHAPTQDPKDSHATEQCSGVVSPSPIGETALAVRRNLCRMVSNVDSAVGDFVGMLKAKGMWENTLMWLTTDNGGMTYGIAADGVGPEGVSASSNWPLRGGKGTLFEGGVRGLSFVAGGVLPAAARGTSRTGLMQHVDIPATMAKLAGAAWSRGTPDGLDMWGAVAHGAASPRTEVPLNVDTCVGVTGGPPCMPHTKYNALIASNWKLIEANWFPGIMGHGCANTTWCTGAGFYDGWWTVDPYEHMPYNATTQGAVAASGLKKGGLWLFDLAHDPNEEANVALANLAVVQSMRKRLAALADPKQGYRDPQPNIPHVRSLPALHNGTWAPFRKAGETLPPPTAEQVEQAVAALATAYWD